MIEKDPRQYMYEKESQKHLINNRNSSGLTPLYVSSMNGHLNVTIIIVIKSLYFRLLST